ncbi:hypothetical protein [Streptomyces sp. NPDC091259]|uniref:hypothetical protein n=1 Tax=Streptomyces sp. NPDC091259 TaxID=3365976 RepID=UPI0038226FE8
MVDGESEAAGSANVPGTGNMTVTPDHVRALLDASNEEKVLICIAGRVEVVGAADLQESRYTGVLRVVSSADLAAMAALGPPQKADPKVLASLLQAALSQLGA